MTPTSSTCPNCGAPLSGNFCQNCGQKAALHKITVGYLFHELFHALTHADKGFLLLMRELFTRPGHVANEYISGKRKKYFNPLSYMVIVSAFFAIISAKSGYFEAMGHFGSGDGARGMPPKIREYAAQVMAVVIEHGKIISLILMVPLNSFLTWIFFRKIKRNFAENLVLGSLMIGQINLVLSVVCIPAFLLFGHATINNWIFQVLSLLYRMIAYRQFFRENIFLTILKSFLIALLFVPLFWFLIFAFVFIRGMLH